MSVNARSARENASETIAPPSTTEPGVDLRVVIFAISDGHLRLRLDRQPTGWVLPRSAPEAGASLDASAREIIFSRLNHNEQYLEQLYTLSLQENDTWVIIISYIALVSASQFPLRDEGGAWLPVDELPPLNEADRMVVQYALMRLRAKLSYTTIAFQMLPESFTLSELQSAYETILGKQLDKRNFRRRMTASGILSLTGTTKRDGSHRPARLYRFRPDRDPTNYLTPPWTQD